MNTRLNELRSQIGNIDREIVAALAQRSRFGCSARPVPAAATARTDDLLAARIQTEYARVVTEKFPVCADGSKAGAACEAADRTVLDALRRRMRVALEIARAKAAGQTPHFRALVAARDTAGLERAITQPAIEEQVIARALTAARELCVDGLSANFPDTVAAIFRDGIIPLARRIQVEALLDGK